ncbi:GNAT family N-acetyltransferase [Aureisphaera sp. CAU 1614]|uniref:GNAT family N-acetyltransferase n=1 Tax=Halomarinibacterium sedimenti TaxID=2857106 RepID=A0A9X1JXS4_9FLAO|nr:GNAT family N-acetyltransferase [Halomarinibacterium sedimenti]MBW2938403.1 GNAT family N-acetyltransferase [Halomarinibacterium sedimenti]
MNAPIIRPIQPKDNVQVAKIIRRVLEDFNVPKVGTAYADASLDCMYETYQKTRSAYFVLEENGKLIGGGGIAQLDNYEGNVCELQKMYFLDEARGRGLGTKMIDICLNKAKEFGYEKCYLETMSYMEAAQKLYKKYGFRYIDGAMGDTGHHACGVNMLLDL